MVIKTYKPPEGYVTLSDAARESGYSRQQVGELVRKGVIESKRIGRKRWYISEESLKNYLTTRKEKKGNWEKTRRRIERAYDQVVQHCDSVEEVIEKMEEMFADQDDGQINSEDITKVVQGFELKDYSHR